MPFGIGPTELIIVLVLVMLLFGVGKLPEVGAGLGKGIREFKDSLTDRGDDDDDTASQRPVLSSRPTTQSTRDDDRSAQGPVLTTHQPSQTTRDDDDHPSQGPEVKG